MHLRKKCVRQCKSADAVDDSHRTAVAAGGNCLRDYRRILTAAPGEVSVRFAIVDQIEEWFGEKMKTVQDKKSAGNAHRRI